MIKLVLVILDIGPHLSLRENACIHFQKGFIFSKTSGVNPRSLLKMSSAKKCFPGFFQKYQTH